MSYEDVFAKSDTTDAILVVDTKKLHVNKSVLSHHSPFFKSLFEWDFKKESIDEYPIKNVEFDDFVTLLSLIHGRPITPNGDRVGKILDLAERFSISSVKPYLELLLISSDIRHWEKLQIGDKYQLEKLINHAIDQFTKHDKHNFIKSKLYYSLSDGTKAQVLHHLLTLYTCKCPTTIRQAEL
uniref:BTB domain-containing protein n=1 Tax=Caenorhabditis tropicalis TaxID=1561998 RepID=A0A1I7UI47_9PELO